MAFNGIIPSLFDRADGGLTNGNGTATAEGSVLINYAQGNNTSIFEEYSNSPTVEFTEQCTITHRFNCDYNTGQLIMILYPRGTIMTDSLGNLTRVLSTTMAIIQKSGGLMCDVTVTSEAQSFATPPDEFDIEPVELNPALEKHPRYSALTYHDRYIIRGADVSDDIDVAQTYKNIISTMSSSVDQAVNEQGQAQELLYKKHKGEDSFYLSGYKIIYSKYFWAPPILNPGGYIQDPFLEGGLPYPFWSATGENDGTNIFQQTTGYNENMFPNTGPTSAAPYGLSWLRQTDQLHLQRTWYKLTQTWIGGPLGHWDNELYNAELQPLQTSENEGALQI